MGRTFYEVAFDAGAGEACELVLPPATFQNKMRRPLRLQSVLITSRAPDVVHYVAELVEEGPDFVVPEERRTLGGRLGEVADPVGEVSSSPAKSIVGGGNVHRGGGRLALSGARVQAAGLHGEHGRVSVLALLKEM